MQEGLPSPAYSVTVTSTDLTPAAEQHISTDRETIRQWAHRHDAAPVRRSSDRSLDLVSTAGVGAEHDRLDWDTFYDGLDSENRVVLYTEDAGETPLEVVTHEQASSRSDIEARQIRDRLVESGTVTSTTQETTAVQTAVLEEATLESELVGREIVDEDLRDVELVERTVTDCNIVPPADSVTAETFDHGRYFASLESSRDESTRRIERSHADSGSRTWVATDTESSLLNTAEIDVREVWIASRELTERFTVESRVIGTDATDPETVEEYDLDVERLQRSVVEQGVLDVGNDPDRVMREFEIESEPGEGDRVHTHFTRTSVVEDRVIDRTRAHATIDSTDLAEMDFAAADHVVSEEATETMGLESGGVSLAAADVGKDIVDATGNTVGTLDRVTDGGQTAHVETHSSLTDSIMSALDWSDEDDHEMEIYAGQVTRVTHEEVRLKRYEQLAEHREANGSN